MKIYVGVTDYDWYSILKQHNCDEVNFWKPGGNTNFKAIDINEMFLFKLHSPHKFIVGGGFFVRFSILPTYLYMGYIWDRKWSKYFTEWNFASNRYSYLV